MISVVVCSINPVLAEQIKSNIDNTIGVDWQPVFISNKSPSLGITEVYNKGIHLAKFPVICFVHEDVAFLTNNWGKLLLSYFAADESLGLVGIAGARYKSRTPSGWMTGIPEFDRYNILHKDAAGKNIMMQFGKDSAPLHPVVTLDGVFMCGRKKIFEMFPFDQQLLTGFHLYDIDISFRISREYKVAVSYEIELVHFTEGGDFGDKWIEHTLRWHEKYAEQLPVSIVQQQNIHSRNYERQVSEFWLKRLRTERITIRNKRRWLSASGAVGKLGQWPGIALLFLFKPLRKVFKRKSKLTE